MKRYYTLYYLLFMIMIMGAFASMAQNNYGMKLVGFSSLGFAILFFYEAAFDQKRKINIDLFDKILLFIELIVLGGLSLLIFFRSFFININKATELFALLMFILIIIYIIFLAGYLRKWWEESKVIAVGLLFYFLVLIFFLTTAILATSFHNHSHVTGFAGFITIIIFVAWFALNQKVMAHGEHTSIPSEIWKMRNKSTIVLVASVVIALFFILQRSNLIPSLYTSEKPSGYLQLVRQAEEGLENNSDDNLYELFDERYKKFIEKHGK